MYRICEDNSVEQLCISDSSIQINILESVSSKDLENHISQASYGEIRNLITQIFNSFQVSLEKLSVSAVSSPASGPHCYYYNEGIYKTIEVPDLLSQTVLAGIHLSDGQNLHRSIGMVKADELRDKYRQIDTVCYDSIDNKIKALIESARKILLAKE